MADAAEATRSLTRIALASAPRVSHVIAPAIGCLALAVLFFDGLIGRAFLVAGITLIALIFLIRFLELRHKKNQANVWHTAEMMSEHDAAPCFGTDEEGRILHRNPAARLRFPAKASHLSGAIGDLFATPKPSCVACRPRQRRKALLQRISWPPRALCACRCIVLIRLDIFGELTNASIR